MKNKIIFLIAVFALLYTASSAVCGEENHRADIPDHAEFIDEPVFNGYIYFVQSKNNFKTTVLLIHGIGDDASDIWKDLVPVLEKQYRVIYFDLPGFGRSAKGEDVYSPGKYAALIKWIYDHYVDGPMYLIGHSLGGSIALYYAGIYPETLKRLVLVDAAGILHRTALATGIVGLRMSERGKDSLFKEQYEKLRDRIVSKLQTSSSRRGSDDSTSDFDYSILKEKVFQTPQSTASMSLIFTDFSEQVDSLRIPVWLIWGEKDFVAPLRTGKMLASIIPGSILKIMPGVGHSPMIDHPSEFQRLILESLDEKILKPREIRKQPAAQKSIMLEGKKNLLLQGNFNRIEIRNCRNIRLKNITARRISISDSTVEIENVFIETKEQALVAADSVVKITGGQLSAGVGIETSKSSIDLAGVKIRAKKAAVASSGEAGSVVVFSMCKIESPHNNCHIHDIFEVTGNNPL